MVELPVRKHPQSLRVQTLSSRAFPGTSIFIFKSQRQISTIPKAPNQYQFATSSRNLHALTPSDIPKFCSSGQGGSSLRCSAARQWCQVAIHNLETPNYSKTNLNKLFLRLVMERLSVRSVLKSSTSTP
ncbi:hypothetical protein PM082_020636 [Marasmius tenuissimus]|nr:hypothetical protein PM082_020636 [Marasmius tenuissimus]